MSRRIVQRSVLSVVACVMLWPAATAQAGRLIATGHDADLHCAGGGPQCAFFKTAVDYARGGAANPSLPVLVLDTSAGQVASALDSAYGVGVVPRVVVDPRAPEFSTTPITTALYSAIIVASDFTCGGCDLNLPVDT